MTQFARDFVDSIEGHSLDISTKELSGVNNLVIHGKLTFDLKLIVGGADILYIQRYIRERLGIYRHQQESDA